MRRAIPKETSLSYVYFWLFGGGIGGGAPIYGRSKWLPWIAFKDVHLGL